MTERSRFPLEAGMGAPSSIPRFFLKSPPIKTDTPMACPTPPSPNLKIKPHSTESTQSPLEKEFPFQEMIPRKNIRKIGSNNNKTTPEKDGINSTKT